MSADNTVQQGLPSSTTPGRYIQRAGHLTGAKLAGKQFDTERDNEAYCLDCENRITVGRQRSERVEFGHAQSPRCSHRPAQCDAEVAG